MPHRQSLVRRVAELRRCYTSENDSILMPAAVSAARTWDTQDRLTIREALDTHHSTRLLGENTHPPVEPRLRQSLLPDASTLGQQQLEAAVLAALGASCRYPRPSGTYLSSLWSLPIPRPERDELALHKQHSDRAAMLAELLPRTVDDQVVGLAGLRMRLHRRHVELYLADTTPTARILLANVNYRAWAAAMAFVTEITGHTWPTPFDTDLSEAERAAVARGRVTGPVATASALLRRLGMLGHLHWTWIRSEGPSRLRLDWAHGASAAQVATHLVHPITGLPGDDFHVIPSTDGSITVVDRNHPSGQPVEIVLRQSRLDRCIPPVDMYDTRAAWQEYEKVAFAPNPVMPAATRSRTSLGTAMVERLDFGPAECLDSLTTSAPE